MYFNPLGNSQVQFPTRALVVLLWQVHYKYLIRNLMTIEDADINVLTWMG